MRTRRGARPALLLAALALLGPAAAAAQPVLVSPDQGRFRINGAVETQLRALSDSFHGDRFYLSQSAFVLNLEPELDVAPDGWGPFDLISAFARIEARYDCVFNGCGTIGATREFGGSSRQAPAGNWTDGPTQTRLGGIELDEVGRGRRRVHQNGLDLLPITAAPGFLPAYDVGISPETVAAAFGRKGNDLFAWKKIDGPGQKLAAPLGPWPYGSTIRANGALQNEESTTLPLPFRPETDSLYTPTAALRRNLGKFDSFDQNFSESELAWNRGGSQDEWELKEAYFDLEFLESRLWIRAGKQNIVWGKTELFRTTDQLNPIDIGLASLPSLEESRIALWSLRSVYSFYEVGPFQDVRLEVAANFDEVEPIDTGRCGEPYTVWLICFKSTGLWAHGTSGVGLAGERRPPDPWDSQKGIEFGVRVEFRWDRFSFALSNFYGYDDIPEIKLFNEYERRVDVETGRPLDEQGLPLTTESALGFATGNRQGFDLGCKASLGFGQNAVDIIFGGITGEGPDVSGRCLGDLVNYQEPIRIGALVGTIPMVVAEILAGSATGNLVLVGTLFQLGLPTDSASLIALNRDPNDGPRGGGTLGGSLSFVLTDEQEALLGCGPFYETDCDTDGIDFFNAEASALVQSFPGFERNPIGTRWANGRQVVLPGARGPDDPDYDALVDGCVEPGPPGCNDGDFGRVGDARALLDPDTGEPFPNELGALSQNFATTVAVLGIAEGDDECDLDELATCAGVRAIIGLTGSRRRNVKVGGNGTYGRRDWGWHGGGEARISYPKRNVLGFSMDFADDWTKSTWSAEFTWISGGTWGSNTARDLTQSADVLNLTISADRPTFINFLNANRTFFFNTQWFFRYIPSHDSSFDTNGPLSVLATLAITTGYFQDRLLPSVVLVHDFRSASGGAIWQATYRFSEAFSATIGAINFYGRPQNNRMPKHPIALPDTQTDFGSRTRYEGLSAIEERDELFLRLRYTF